MAKNISSEKRPSQMSLKLKFAAHTGDLKFLADDLDASSRRVYIVWINENKIRLATRVWVWYLSSRQGATPSLALAQGPLGHALRNPSHVMRMSCLTPLACWSQNVRNTTSIFLDFLTHWRESAKGIHARPEWRRVKMAHLCQLREGIF